MSTPSLSEMVFAPIMKAVEGIEQRLSNLEATWGLFKANFSSDHMVTQKLCIADESGEQTCITKAQLDLVLASLKPAETHAEAPLPAAPAVAQAPAEMPAAAEPAIEPEPAAELATVPAEHAVTEDATTTVTTAEIEASPESNDVEHTGSLPEPGAALISYPEVETILP